MDVCAFRSSAKEKPRMWKTSVAAALVCASFAAHAQTDAQPAVRWELQVMRDGRKVDAFEGTTTVGQAYTGTHHHEVVHEVGCKDSPAGSIDLARTLTVSPTQADANGVTLAIDAQETIEDDSAPRTTEGCKLPPQPRRVTASHPGLNVPAGQWAAWTIVDKSPNLIYRVSASVVSH
jgi:hypothetical protein